MKAHRHPLRSFLLRTLDSGTTIVDRRLEQIAADLARRNVGFSCDVDLLRLTCTLSVWSQPRDPGAVLRQPHDPPGGTRPTTDDPSAGAPLPPFIDEMPCTCVDGDPQAGECWPCGARACPHREVLHFHHDGCPACIEAAEAEDAYVASCATACRCCFSCSPVCEGVLSGGVCDQRCSCSRDWEDSIEHASADEIDETKPLASTAPASRGMTTSEAYHAADEYGVPPDFVAASERFRREAQTRRADLDKPSPPAVPSPNSTLEAIDPLLAAHAIVDELANGMPLDLDPANRPALVERFTEVIASVGVRPAALPRSDSPMAVFHRAWGLAKGLPGYDKGAWKAAHALLEPTRTCDLCLNAGLYPYCQRCGREPPQAGVVYLAGRYSRRAELAKHRSALQRLGYDVRSRWLDGSHDVRGELSDDALVAEARRFAREDWEDLAQASIVVSFTEQPRASNSRGGRHVEFGAGLALGKRLLLVGPRENVFHALPQVEHFRTWPDALAALAGALDEVE